MGGEKAVGAPGITADDVLYIREAFTDSIREYVRSVYEEGPTNHLGQ